MCIIGAVGRKSALATWLLELEAEDLEQILLRRKDAAEAEPYSIRRLADELSASGSVKPAVEALDRACLDVLNAAIGLGEHPSAEKLAKLFGVPREVPRREFDRILTELRTNALLWPTGDGRLRTVTGLRASASPDRITPTPPAPQRVERDPAVVDESATALAMSTVDGVTRVVELCDAQDVVVRRYGGGLGVRELRRLATELRTDEQRARLWVELAVHADLLAMEERDRWAHPSEDHVQHLLPTPKSDDWRPRPPAQRLVALLRVWPELNWAPATAKPRSALADLPSDNGSAIRRGVLDRYAAEPEGEALVDRAEVAADLTFRVPSVHTVPATSAAVVEAESLGLISLGALTSLGRAVVANEPDGLAEAAERLIPAPTGQARLQADLTAIVSGLPTAELSALLNLTADSDERDTASVWRFSAASVRRALDSGRSAEELLVDLAAVAERELPQPLDYLVRDVARRHGQINVTTVACCVRTGDPALLQEIARHHGLRSLALSALGPTVLASAKPAEETLALLRSVGYAPTTATADGASVVERTEPRRAQPQPRERSARSTGYDWHRPMSAEAVAKLAHTLVERERPEPEPEVRPHAASPRMSTARLLRDQSLVLPDTEVILLAEAMITQTSVEIELASGPRETVKLVITPLGHAAGNLTANCEPQGDPREFPVSHIRSVRVPGGPGNPPG
jgi:hypothetical protein